MPGDRWPVQPGCGPGLRLHHLDAWWHPELRDTVGELCDWSDSPATASGRWSWTAGPARTNRGSAWPGGAPATSGRRVCSRACRTGLSLLADMSARSYRPGAARAILDAARPEWCGCARPRRRADRHLAAALRSSDRTSSRRHRTAPALPAWPRRTRVSWPGSGRSPCGL